MNLICLLLSILSTYIQISFQEILLQPFQNATINEETHREDGDTPLTSTSAPFMLDNVKKQNLSRDQNISRIKLICVNGT